MPEIIIIVILLSVVAMLFRVFSTEVTFSRRQRGTFLLLLGGGIALLWVSVGKDVDVFSQTEGILMGFIGILFTFYIISFLISLLFPSRRPLIVFVSLVLVLLTSIYSVFNAARLPGVTEVTVPIKNLAAPLSGFTVVQLSDLHLGTIYKPRWLREVVDRINRLAPDLVVITGDLIDRDDAVEDWTPYARVLKDLKSSHGVFAVAGNHDNDRGGGVFRTICEAAGITVLNNAGRTVARYLHVVGVTDKRNAEMYPELEPPDLRKAFNGIEPSLPVIFLCHRPVFFTAARSYGADLQLSGHIHAGQVPPMDILSFIFYPYSYGLYKKDDSYIYTTCGTGVMNVPMRLFSTNEIVKIVLHPAVPTGRDM